MNDRLENDAGTARVTDLRGYRTHLVERAIAYMRSRLDAPGALRELAASIGSNERQLHRAFVASTGESPAQHWRRLRLEQAHKLLMNTRQPVTQIAYATGFADASHFIHWFRKRFGETPCVYRKQRHAPERLVAPPR